MFIVMYGFFQLLEALLTQSLLVLLIETLVLGIFIWILEIRLHDRLFHFLFAHISESLLHVILDDDFTDVTSFGCPAHRLREDELLLGLGHLGKVKAGDEGN